MSEDVKKEQQGDSGETADTPVEGNSPGEKSLDPEDQTFWEDSVDANTVDISAGKMGDKDAAGGDQPDEQEPVAETNPEQEEAQTEDKTSEPDTSVEDPPAPAEQAQQPEGNEEEAPTTRWR